MQHRRRDFSWPWPRIKRLLTNFHGNGRLFWWRGLLTRGRLRWRNHLVCSTKRPAKTVRHLAAIRPSVALRRTSTFFSIVVQYNGRSLATSTIWLPSRAPTPPIIASASPTENTTATTRGIRSRRSVPTSGDSTKLSNTATVIGQSDILAEIERGDNRHSYRQCGQGVITRSRRGIDVGGRGRIRSYFGHGWIRSRTVPRQYAREA